jgi:hypothetical protein
MNILLHKNLSSGDWLVISKNKPNHELKMTHFKTKYFRTHKGAVNYRIKNCNNWESWGVYKLDHNSLFDQLNNMVLV